MDSDIFTAHRTLPDKRGRKRRTVCGIGINDAWFRSQWYENGVKHLDPSYSSWKNMLRRCASESYHKTRPTYKGTEVCSEWLVFSNFDKWFVENYVCGWELDKDILSNGVSLYSPATCIFIPQSVNSFMTHFKDINRKNIEQWRQERREKLYSIKTTLDSIDGRLFSIILERIDCSE